MNLKYITNQSDDSAIMNIYKPIGGQDGINGSDFAAELLFLEQIGVKTVDIHINSPGGSVLDGFSIFAAIRNCNNRGLCDVNTYVDYLAASIAGVVALAGKKRTIVSNGRFMMHNVSGPDSTDKDKEILADLKSTIVDIFSSFGNNTPEMISKLMDQETWMNPKKAIKAGFFHDTFPAIVPDDQPKENSVLEMYEYANQIIQSKTATEKINNMIEKEYSDLKIKYAEIENKLSSSEAKLKDLEKETEEEKESSEKTIKDQAEEIKNLKGKLEAKEAEEKAKTDKEAVEFVENLVKTGVIDKKTKDDNIAAAKKDLPGFKNIMASIKGVGVARFSNVAGSEDDKKKKGSEDREDWSYRDWEKKDPSGLAKKKAEDPEWANELYNQTYKIK